MADIASQHDSKDLTPPDIHQAPTTILSLNYDILLNVFTAFENISNPVSPNGHKKHLLWAGLTCTAFRDSSMDILWQSMDSIIPLIRLLPTVEIMICGDIRDEDMTRFELYAKRIRRFTRSISMPPPVDRDAYRSFGQPPPIQVIPSLAPSIYALLEPFFHITHLTFSSIQSLSAPEAHFFIPHCSTFRDSRDTTFSVSSVSPLRRMGLANNSTSITASSTLERVEIRDPIHIRKLDDDLLRMRPFMYALKTRAPDIQHLVITIQTSPRLWEFIVEFKNLRSLEISGIADVVIFRRLAISLKELQRLVINFLDTAPLRTSFPVIDADTDLTFPFEKLRTLVFKGKGSTVASYLVCMRGGSVGNLYLNLNTDPDSSSRFNTALEQWDTCMSVMKEHWATSLESIRLETFEKVTISMSSTFFSQLSATSLKYVEFEGKISTRDCDMLARSLPCMISLYIHLVEGPSSVSRGRFVKGTGAESLGSDIFASFATHCPNLHSMDVGFEKSFTSFSLSKSPVHAHSLATLSITSEDRLDVNNLQHAIQAARLLHRIFPFLEVLRTRDNHASTPFWVHVYELYKEFRKLSEPQDDDAVLGSFMALRKKKKKGKK